MYWCRRRLSFTIVGPEGCSTVRLSKPFARVGSCAGGEIVLSHPSIGRRAAYFHATDDAIWCWSFGRSASRSLWPVRIRPSTGVRLGSYRLSVEFADGVEPVDPTNIGSTSRHSSVIARTPFDLTFSSVGDTFSVGHTLADPFAVIGRGPPSNFILADERLSRVHCLLYRCQEHLWVIDLLSSNGTRRAGQRVEAVSLKPGERLGLGSYWFSYSKTHERCTEQAEGHFNRPLIVEQTIVREHREQIVTRIVQNGAPPGENYKRSKDRDATTSNVLVVGDEAVTVVDGPAKVVDGVPSAALSDRTAISTTAVRRTEPLRVSACSGPLPLRPTLSNQAGSLKTSTSEAAATKPQGAQPCREAVSNLCYQQVLDRLIDANSRRGGRSLHRTWLIAAGLITLVSLGAVACYFLGVSSIEPRLRAGD